ncbi:Maf family protein [Aliiglaciecola sp. CAU 1673]|uniref:Maf family protein n=1 Tax=Aliiglaciecola sp. CAU 1673 TaxID=3032595 RepID=UPI0023D9E985|nr:Maf family protein [Aliiglaciecola sp. CAU 1673]MDF2179125.1 Maf family protein [Aliiglaciecola sp. CAU 1673]
MLVLASQSPRRAELLRQLQIPFSQLSTNVNEAVRDGEMPQDYVVRVARDKAEMGWRQAGHIDPVLGADTAVVSRNHILGKPQDQADFERMMGLLSGTTHQVMTAVALRNERGLKHRLVITEVSMKVLSKAEMDWYWQSGEPTDKAGGYGIQGLAGRFVTRIVGSYSAVVGLPLYETAELLREHNLL